MLWPNIINAFLFAIIREIEVFVEIKQKFQDVQNQEECTYVFHKATALI